MFIPLWLASINHSTCSQQHYAQKKWQPSVGCHFKEKVFFTMGCSKKLYNVLGVFTVVIICDINRKVCPNLHKILLYLLCIFYIIFSYMTFYRKKSIQLIFLSLFISYMIPFSFVRIFCFIVLYLLFFQSFYGRKFFPSMYF